ncbi:proteasome subunit alpha type-5 [Platysternon megacephalum]|uniref:Proteasome subunit alpha type-5 n=1 Tax=Platysternon megacephalum TaxID=55544 RepID=A0A4D9DYH7_9SAUR|nr:proteasome subunit alpha type-5 [Platysternon megacephalum]
MPSHSKRQALPQGAPRLIRQGRRRLGEGMLFSLVTDGDQRQWGRFCIALHLAPSFPLVQNTPVPEGGWFSLAEGTTPVQGSDDLSVWHCRASATGPATLQWTGNIVPGAGLAGAEVEPTAARIPDAPVVFTRRGRRESGLSESLPPPHTPCPTCLA